MGSFSTMARPEVTAPHLVPQMDRAQRHKYGPYELVEYAPAERTCSGLNRALGTRP